MGKVIIIGAGGQIGTELTLKLRQLKGKENVIAADVKSECPNLLEEGPYQQLDILDAEKVKKVIIENNVKEVYLLAALLSATAEKNPHFAWQLNMDGLFTILELAKDKIIDKIFWPSSIAVFGPTTPRENTPQYTVMEPSTVYGISKQAGERWCEYYFNKFGVDVRSIRYPGLISYTSLPGGGTTDYAVDIFYQAKAKKSYTSFLSENSALPMMYMDDAIRATIELMEAPSEKIRIRSSYNLSALSFTPKQLSEEIKKRIPDFTIEYAPDFRQKIADSWPASIDDSSAQNDWQWHAQYDLAKLVDVMLSNVDVSMIA